MQLINFKIISRLLGFLLLSESVVLFSVTLISLIYSESDALYFLYSGFIAASSALILIFSGRNARKSFGKREGSVIVTSTWIAFSVFGSLPFWLSKAIPSYTDAFFETISGFTTTGASILNNIENLSHGMLFWRSLTHWIGGLGIIVISMAILPLFGLNGNHLFSAESSGPTKDKLYPKISDTAKRLFIIYIFLTILEALFLRFGGMEWFDAFCHSFSTIATGGFSTKQSSIGYWESPYIQYIIIIFMILSGVNFTMYFLALKNRWDKIKVNEELQLYLMIIGLISIVVTLANINFSAPLTLSALEKYWRDSLFTISSLISSTGFVTVDYMQWKPVVLVILTLVMLTGASAGSTSGGIKISRILISFKAIYHEFKLLIHPNAVIPVRLSGHSISRDTVTQVVVFILLYFIIIIAGILFLSLSGMGLLESVSGIIACIGAVGPGFGTVGPTGSFADIPEFSKWFLSFIMLLGRLELLTVLVLFTKTFWKK